MSHESCHSSTQADLSFVALSPHSSQPSAQKKRPGGLQGLASSEPALSCILTTSSLTYCLSGSPRQNHPSSPQGPASSKTALTSYSRVSALTYPSAGPPRQHVPGGLQGFGSSKTARSHLSSISTLIYRLTGPPGQAHFGGYNAHPQPPNFGPYGGPFGGAPVGTNTTAKKASGASKPATPSGKVIIDLQMGFEWNRESLALLCKWREVNKKGAKFIVATGAFPGHTIESLDAAWADHRTEARKFYKEVFGKNSS